MVNLHVTLIFATV